MRLLVAAVVLAMTAGAADASCGKASWYSSKGNTTAHKSLKFGTRLRVTNTANGKTVDVTIHDRGPFIKGRILDLSKPAASQLAMIKSGEAHVCFEVLR